MDNNSIVTKNLRSLRDKFGYTQTFIAEYLNITPAAVNQYEKDARTILISAIEKLALLYNVKEHELYEKNPEKQSVITAFAFRVSEITPLDMQNISKFKKIIYNYINMSNAIENE